MNVAADKYEGKKFGRLTILSFYSSVNYVKKYNCRCECGNEKVVYLSNLTTGKTTSCGCYNKEVSSKTASTHGQSKTRLYSIWVNMKTRCYNKRVEGYKNYGARGIKICDEWKNDYLKFREWALGNGYDDELTIERMDVDGDYTPSNCEWIPSGDQSKNRRGNRYVTIEGRTMTLKEWCRFYGLNYKSVHVNVSRGADEIEAINHGKLIKQRKLDGKHSIRVKSLTDEEIAYGESKGIPYQTLLKRRQKGWSRHDAINVPFRGQRKKIELEGE